MSLPIFTSSQITAGEMMLGDFNQFVIAEGGPIEIQVLREADAKELKVDLLAVTRMDCAARQSACFQRLYGITS